MDKIKSIDLKSIDYKKILQSIAAGLDRVKVILISLLVLAILSFTILEVSKLSTATVTQQQKDQANLEVDATTISFDQELIREIKNRTEDQRQLGPIRSYSGPNPFDRNESIQ